MEFINIITSFLSNVERNLFGTPQKWAKVHPVNNLIQKHDIETGLYHGENMCRITIYSSTEECKWDAGQII